MTAHRCDKLERCPACNQPRGAHVRGFDKCAESLRGLLANVSDRLLLEEVHRRKLAREKERV